MAEITVALISKLRQRTGAGLGNCRKALVETDGDIEAAIDELRKKGIATAAKKAGRATKEGVIAQSIAAGAKSGVLLEVNCETDFVAKNDKFQDFCNGLAADLLADPNADLETKRTEAVAEIGENIQIARHETLTVDGNGCVTAYIHHGSKIGVLVEIAVGQEDTVENDAFRTLAKDITLQIAAADPITVTRDEIDPALIEKEKEIAAEQFKDKPAQALEGIIKGKLEKYYQEKCLVDQLFVKQGDLALKDYIGNTAKEVGDEITVKRFLRFQVGETAVD
ncbi:MAG: translation elongation factor Ts [Verrucomicrobiales bacterium]|nr:translation elongation factor Ts [Verrucomicrobiales bacterium]